jgi:hypothetical protein
VKAQRDRPWLAYSICGLYIVRTIVLMVPFSDALTSFISPKTPAWVSMLIFSLCLVLAPLCIGPLSISIYVRVPLYALLLASCLFYPVSFRMHPAVAIAILVLAYIEIWWLIPRWKAERNHEPALESASRIVSKPKS